MPSVNVAAYDESMAERWDRFILEDSFNGTFLQTRRFLGYHPEGRFEDASLMVWKGTSDLLAVIPAARVMREGAPTLVSHPGSTFGGPVISSRFYDRAHAEALIEALEGYLRDASYASCVLKPSSQAFSNASCDLLEYLLLLHGWSQSCELSLVIDLARYDADIPSNFTGRRRRGWRKGSRVGLELRRLAGAGEVDEFYRVLEGNLAKFGARPVHSRLELDELSHRLGGEQLRFYGCYHGGSMVAGSMVFCFGDGVFHTQYLAADQEKLDLHASEYMDAELIATARREGFRTFSFGISTEEGGRVLNRGLADFKEGFGARASNNRTFIKGFADA